MTHDELLAKITPTDWRDGIPQRDAALRAVVELHQQRDDNSCSHCITWYPCSTIQAIERELG